MERTVPTSLDELSGATRVGGGGAAVAAGGGGGGAAAAAPAKAAGMKQYELSDVGTHTTKEDCWVVLHGRVLDVTNFLGDHPGGELAILTFAGKDASAEFDMIHPPDVIEKYLDPAAHVGVIKGSAAAAAAMESGGGGGGGAGAALLGVGKGRDDAKNWGDYPHQTQWSWFSAIWLMVVAFLKEVLLTIFSVISPKASFVILSVCVLNCIRVWHNGHFPWLQVGNPESHMPEWPAGATAWNTHSWLTGPPQ
jgi:cytochrome b involved in lipid metabolism